MTIKKLMKIIINITPLLLKEGKNVRKMHKEFVHAILHVSKEVDFDPLEFLIVTTPSKLTAQ